MKPHRFDADKSTAVFERRNKSARLPKGSHLCASRSFCCALQNCPTAYFALPAQKGKSDTATAVKTHRAKTPAPLLRIEQCAANVSRYISAQRG